MSNATAPAAFDSDRFALMFGPLAASTHPERYHLMVLSPAGGLDLMIPWYSMLAAAPKILLHEEAFSWLSMSRDPVAIHCALLHCLLLECYHRAGERFPQGICAQAASPSEPKAPHSGPMTAFELIEPHGPSHADSISLAALRAILNHSAHVAPGSTACPIPERISSMLAQALLGSPKHESAQIIASAGEAIALNRASSEPNSPARSARI